MGYFARSEPNHTANRAKRKPRGQIETGAVRLAAHRFRNTQGVKHVRVGVDCIGVGVGAVIVNEQGQVFLAKRGKNSGNERGLWEFPGGAVDFGETLRDAIVREIREEYGITIAVEDLLTVTDHILPEEGQHWVSPSFVCRIVSGTPVIAEPDKCEAIGWFDLDNMPPSLSKVTQHDLEEYREYLRSRQ